MDDKGLNLRERGNLADPSNDKVNEPEDKEVRGVEIGERAVFQPKFLPGWQNPVLDIDFHRHPPQKSKRNQGQMGLVDHVGVL